MPSSPGIRAWIPPATLVGLVVDDVAGDDEAQVGHVHDAGVRGVGHTDWNDRGRRTPITISVPSSGCGPTGSSVNWSGKNPPHARRYPGEICSFIPGMDSVNAIGLACGKAARISVSPRKWSAWGWVM